MSNENRMNNGSEEEKKNELEKKIDFSKNIEALKAVKAGNPMKELGKLCDEIIAFYKKKQEMLDNHIPIEEEKKKFIYHINEKTEQLLIEAINMGSKENRNDKIRKIYIWYNDKIQCDKELKKITERTEKEWYQEEDPEPMKSEPETQADMKKHRCGEIGGFESANKRLEEYCTKKIPKENKNNQINFQDENLNFYSKSFGYKTMSTFSGAGTMGMNSTGYFSNFSRQSTQYATFYKPGNKEICTGGDKFSRTGFDFRKNKQESSLTFIKNPYEYDFLQLEKGIMQEKHKQLMEKRNLEEISNGVLEHGFKKSFYKGSITQKLEMNHMIGKYKEYLEERRILEEKKRKEDEIRRKKEELEKRKKLEKEKEEKMSKIRQVRKQKKKEPISHEIIESERNQKNEHYTEEIDSEKNTVPLKAKEEIIEEVDNENEVMSNKNKKDTSATREMNSKKIDLNHIKYISPNINEIDIINTSPFSQTEEMKEAQFFEIKYKEKSVKLREKAALEQYNNYKKKQLELEINNDNGNNNKNPEKVVIPSNLSSYFLLSNNIFYRRNIGKTLNNFKELDMPRGRYLESNCISPLSFYDNKNKTFRGEKKIIEDKFVLTDNFALKTFYKFKDNFLQMRKTLSAHNEKSFKNTLLFKNSKPKYRIKLNSMVKIPDDQNKFPIYFLPISNEGKLKKNI